MGKAWRWLDQLQTMATDDEGSFAPAGSAALAQLLAGEKDDEGRWLIEPGVIAAYRRFITLDDARIVLAAEIETRASAARLAVAGTLDAGKLAIYREKCDLAQLALAGDASALADLAPEAQARGVSPSDLAALIRLRGEAWRSAGLAIDAAAAAHKLAISALDLDGANAYDAAAGWPG